MQLYIHVIRGILTNYLGRLQVLLDTSCCATIKMQNKDTIVSVSAVVCW